MRVEPSPGAFNTEQYDVYPGDNTPGPTVDTEFPGAQWEWTIPRGHLSIHVDLIYNMILHISPPGGGGGGYSLCDG